MTRVKVHVVRGRQCYGILDARHLMVRIRRLSSGFGGGGADCVVAFQFYARDMVCLAQNVGIHVFRGRPFVGILDTRQFVVRIHRRDLVLVFRIIVLFSSYGQDFVFVLWNFVVVYVFFSKAIPI